MNKILKEHEEVNIHIKRNGFLIGIILLPFNIFIYIIYAFLNFVYCYVKWYDGTKPEEYSRFIDFCFGLKNKD